MDKLVIDLILADFKEKSGGVDPMSREFIFDRKYARLRNSGRLLAGTHGSRSPLSFMLREGMTQDRREKLFPGDFDLGNLRPVPLERCSYEKLADQLYGEGRNSKSADDAFDTIKQRIYRITGKKMHEHFKINKSKALKVAKTLDLLTRNREPRLMQLLTPPVPDKKFSMSLRDAYPFEKNQEQVWLLADLKAYLSVELTEQRFEEIHLLFSTLHELMDNIVMNVEKILVEADRSAYAPMASAYADLVKAAKSFQFEHEPKEIDLDEELFIHLHTLEFAHFATGFPKLIKAAIPTTLVTPVFTELRTLAQQAFPSNALEVREYDRLMTIPEVTEFLRLWQGDINAITTKALGISLTVTELEHITTDIQNLLLTFRLFRDNSQPEFQPEAIRVSPWHVVAALCCVCYTLNEADNFKPYWLGQQAQGGSVNTSNKVSPFEIDPAVDRVPEEHRHIWCNRLEWFADALRGHAEEKMQRFEFRSVLVEKVADICRTNNTDRMAQELDNFLEYIKKRAIRYRTSA